MLSEEFFTRLVEFWAFEHAFMWRLAVASVVAGALCGVLGTHLVLRRYSLLGDVLGHASWPGVVVGFWIAGGALPWLLPLAVTSALAAAALVIWLVRQPGLREDAVMGIVLATAFGTGSLLWSLAQSSGAYLAGADDALLGNAAAISPSSTVALAVLACVVIFVLVFLHRRWAGWLLDPDWARSAGWNVTLLEGGLILLLALTVVVAAPVIGVLLITAMLVIPATTAFMFAKSLRAAMWLAGLFGAAVGLIGAWLSFSFDNLATGPAIALVGGSLFFLLRLVTRRRDVLA